MSELEHHYANIGAMRQHYVTAGDGYPVVLLHGWPQTWYCWRKVIPLLSNKFRVIVPDLRGLGDSTDPHTGYDKRSVAQDVHQLVTQELGIGEYHLVGHDWGGITAYSLATHFPGAQRTLTVVDLAIPGDGRPNVSQNGRRWHHAFHQTPGLPEALVTGREEIYLRWFYENYGDSPDALSEEEKAEYFRTYAQPDKLRAGFEYYRALETDMAMNAARAKEFRLAIPVLAVGGTGKWGRALECAESLRRLTDDVTELTVDKAGHWVPEEQPEFLVEHMLKFFAAHPGKTQGAPVAKAA